MTQMPVMDFTTDNKIGGFTEHPKFRMETMGEMARVVFLDKGGVTMEFTHNIRKPQIEDGKVKTRLEPKKDSDDKIEVRDLKFVQRHICMGNFITVKESGSDPKNCLSCRYAPDVATVGGAEPRYAGNIFWYNTVAGSTTVASPFAGKVVVWSFAGNLFDTLVGIQAEHGDLRLIDLLCGPLKQKTYQKFEIQPGKGAAWTRTPEAKAFVVEAYRTSRCEDLASMLGRRAKLDYLKRDLETVKEACILAEKLEAGQDDSVPADMLGGAATNGAGDPSEEELDKALNVDDLLTEPVGTEPAVPVPSPSEIDDLLGGETPATEQPASTEAPAASPPTQAAPEQPSFSLDDLLK
jgi:hypothetical protein